MRLTAIYNIINHYAQRLESQVFSYRNTLELKCKNYKKLTNNDS